MSAPAQNVAPVNISMNVIHGGRKTNPIIETFKCELCNQVYIYSNESTLNFFLKKFLLDNCCIFRDEPVQIG